MIGNKECWPDQPLLHEAQHQASATQMKRGFRQDRFAGQQRLSDSLRDVQGPSVMEVCPIPECYQEASIRNGLHFREKPLRVERSLGPWTAPARSKNGFLEDFRALSSSIRTMRLRGTPIVRAV
jgi:hypothetical protein